MSAASLVKSHQRTCAGREGTSVLCQEEKCDLTARCSSIEGFYLPQVFCVSALLIGSCFRINTGRSHRPNSFFDIVRSEAASKYYWGPNTLHYLSTDAPVMRHALRADLRITCAMTVKQDPIDNSIISDADAPLDPGSSCDYRQVLYRSSATLNPMVSFPLQDISLKETFIL